MGEVHFSVKDHVALIVLDNQKKRNAVDAPMREGLEKAYQQVINDDQIRVAVITGAGDKAFSSGGDISAYSEGGVFGPGANPLPPIPRPWPIWKPFIAAIQGYAVGGGFALALSCDLRVVGENALIGPSGLRRGAVQGAQQSQRLTRLIGMSKATELLLLSKYVDGQEAAKIGLAQVCVENNKVLEQAMEWANTIAGYSPWAVQKTKQLIYEGFNMPLEEAFAWEAELTKEGYQREDALEGFSEFLKK
ncbi:MAG: enoyl-CoA hydratase/isomerase family protein [Spongiibacteraceae bacterium]